MGGGKGVVGRVGSKGSVEIVGGLKKAEVAIVVGEAASVFVDRDGVAHAAGNGDLSGVGRSLMDGWLGPLLFGFSLVRVLVFVRVLGGCRLLFCIIVVVAANANG